MDELVKMKTGQYLTFKLDNETFGADIVQVLEILEYVTITKLPNTPEFMCGVINLRGKAIPVIDMRLKLGMPKGDINVNSSIIVLEVNLNDALIILGALVDGVCEVLEIGSEDIEPAPKIGTKLNTELIYGMGKKEDKFIIILNINKTFSFDELTAIHQTTESGT